MGKQIRLFEESKSYSSTQYINEIQKWDTIKQIINDLPHENDELLPGIKWGSCAQLYTPAFWKLQYLLADYSNEVNTHKLCTSIIDEVVMCILGGYGIPSEIGIAAFDTLKGNDIIKQGVSFQNIFQALSAPIATSDGRWVMYRFYNQKSKYIHQFLNRDDLALIPVHDDIELRNWLLTINGIGLKTASWITRNWLKSDKVAILDIHLLRACKLAGVFDCDISAQFDYLLLEKKYLAFCDALEVLASDMDAVIWYYMKKNTKLAIRTLYS